MPSNSATKSKASEMSSVGQRPTQAPWKAGDVILRRNKKVLTTFLIGITIIWILLRVFNYNLMALLRLITIASMTLIFIWNRIIILLFKQFILPRIDPLYTRIEEKIREELSKNRFARISEEFSDNLVSKVNKIIKEFLSHLMDQASGKDLAEKISSQFIQFLVKLLNKASAKYRKPIILALASLYKMSLITKRISPLTLQFSCILCLEALPFLYDYYEKEVDNLAMSVNQFIVNMYKKLFKGKFEEGAVEEKP